MLEDCAVETEGCLFEEGGAAVVQLDALPLNPAGKLDRKALPEPGLASVLSRAYVAPVGEVETVMAGIWAEVLKLERVGRHDHFFEPGAKTAGGGRLG